MHDGYREEWKVQLDAKKANCIIEQGNERAARAPVSGLKQRGGASRESGRRTEEIRWLAGLLACLLVLDRRTGLPSALGD
jgi:hypothetical protein